MTTTTKTKANQYIKPYPQEFREQLVREWLKGGRTLAAVAREAGVNFETLRLWRRKYADDLAKQMGIERKKPLTGGPQAFVVPPPSSASAKTSILVRLDALEAAVAALKQAVGA